MEDEQPAIPLITIERFVDDVDETCIDEDDDDNDVDDNDADEISRRRLLRSPRRRSKAEKHGEEEEEEEEVDEEEDESIDVAREPPVPAPRTSLVVSLASLADVPPRDPDSHSTDPPLPPREPTAALKASTAALVSPPRPAPPSEASLKWRPARPKRTSRELKRGSTASSAVSSEVPSSPTRPYVPRRKSTPSSPESVELAPPLPAKKRDRAPLFRPQTSPKSSAAPRTRRVPPTTTAAARALRAVPPAPDRENVTYFPVVPDTSLYEPLFRRKSSSKDEYLDTDDLKALVHTELPSTRRRKTLVTEKIYSEVGPYHRLTKAATATFGWLYSTKEDYDVTRPPQEEEPDPQDELRVWDLAETILHKDDVFAPLAPLPSEAGGSETSGGSRSSSLKTFSDRMRRMTCTYEPNTDLRTRMIVRRTSSRRATAQDGYSAPNRLARPRTYVRPYAVASVLGLRDRPPSPLISSRDAGGRDFIEGSADIERGEGIAFVGPAAYEPVSPEVAEFGDKTQVMLLR